MHTGGEICHFKLINYHNVVGENTVLRLNILETGVRILVVQNSSRWRLILNHSCENTNLQNVLVENLQFPMLDNI